MTSKVTLGDVTLRGITLDQFPDLKALRYAYFDAIPEICVERPKLVTECHVREGFDPDGLTRCLLEKESISILDKARVYRHVLENREAIVSHKKARGRDMHEFQIKDTSPFAGSTTSKFKGVLLHPELLGLAMWPELLTVTKRPQNPFFIASDDVATLNKECFPPWLDKTVWERTRKSMVADQSQGMDDPMKLMQNMVFFLTSKVLCISHAIPNFSTAVNLGLPEMKDEAHKRANDPTVGDKKEFYTALENVLEGIITYAEKLSVEAAGLWEKEKDPTEKGRLKAIRDIYHNIAIHRRPKQGLITFRQALTTVWICWIAIHLENPNVGMSLGRLDQLLYRFYEEDIKRGRLTVRQAVELICYLWLKIGDHVPIMTESAEQLFGGTGSNQAITIGGVDENGEDTVNDLTYVMLKATELMRLRDPNLNARYHPDKNSDEYLKRVCEVNVITGATPAIHNDKAVIEALRKKHGEDKPEDALKHARDYGIVGCVEPVSAGRTYGHPAAILLNLASALELALFNGKHRHTGETQIGPKTGDPTTFKSYDEFWNAFADQTEFLIEKATTLNNQLGKTHQQFYPTPILSAFFEGPICFEDPAEMDNGKDLIQGGATYNSSGAAIIGFADTVDSLAAIQKWVKWTDNGGTYPFSELLDALKANFDGKYRAMQALFSNQDKTPKYGNEHPDADKIARNVVEMLDNRFREKVNYRGGHYRVGYWTMTTHAAFGRITGSLPNSRKQGENFASGITPVSGVTPFLSKTLGSVAKLPEEALSSGVALNIKFTPETDLQLMRDHLADTVNAFFSGDWGGHNGGFEIQFNIVSGETFQDAIEDPEYYRELLVRVSGYTAYFKDLNPQMQKEIIERTEYLLSTGQAQTSKPVEL